MANPTGFLKRTDSGNNLKLPDTQAALLEELKNGAVAIDQVRMEDLKSLAQYIMGDGHDAFKAAAGEKSFAEFIGLPEGAGYDEVRQTLTAKKTEIAAENSKNGEVSNKASLQRKTVESSQTECNDTESEVKEADKGTSSPSHSPNLEKGKEEFKVEQALPFMKEGTTAKTLKDKMATQVKEGGAINWREIATTYYAPAMGLEDENDERKIVLEALKLLATDEKISNSNYFFMSLNYFAREEIKGCPNVDSGYCKSLVDKAFNIDSSASQKDFTACANSLKKTIGVRSLQRAVYFLPDSDERKTKMAAALQTRLDKQEAPKLSPKNESGSSSSSSTPEAPSFAEFMKDKKTADDVQKAMYPLIAQELYCEAYALGDGDPRKAIFIEGLKAAMRENGVDNPDDELAEWVGAPKAKSSSWVPRWSTGLLAIIALGALAYWQKDNIVNWWHGRKVNEL